MSPNVLTAAIGGGSAVITAVVALLVNHPGFAMLANASTSYGQTATAASPPVETDLKEFFKVLAEEVNRIQRLEDKQQSLRGTPMSRS